MFFSIFKNKSCTLFFFCSWSGQSTPTMPGHIKLIKGQADPDPTEFLLPSIEMKRADQAKVYDTKKSGTFEDILIICYE